MADKLPNAPNSVRPTEDQPPSIPGWVKILALIAILLVILFVALHLTGLAPTGHGM